MIRPCSERYLTSDVGLFSRKRKRKRKRARFYTLSNRSINLSRESVWFFLPPPPLPSPPLLPLLSFYSQFSKLFRRPMCDANFHCVMRKHGVEYPIQNCYLPCITCCSQLFRLVFKQIFLFAPFFRSFFLLSFPLSSFSSSALFFSLPFSFSLCLRTTFIRHKNVNWH